MEVWRICPRRHPALGGEGARVVGGRWNRVGTALVYTSATLSLAVLEYFVNLDAEFAPDDLVSIRIDVPADLPIAAVSARDLPRGWRQSPSPASLAELGTVWAIRRREAVLSVPSAVIPSEKNFLLNPAHPAFPRIRIAAREPFSLDPRLFKRR